VTHDEELAIARQMGLDAVPVPRTPAPVANPPIPKAFKPKFFKALQLVDSIETFAFERFIPSECIVDQTLDARIYHHENSCAVLIRTDMPPPSNLQIWRGTKIKPSDHPDAMSAENFYRWLAVEVRRAYTEFGAKRMAPPLIFRTHGSRWKPWIVPLVGAICKFEVAVPDGQLRENVYANIGVLIPQGTKVDPKHLVKPVVVTNAEEIAPFDPGTAWKKTT
jgi:hypothetical protein